MLADEERGSAWTRVILGLNAREIHLCGNPSALDIVKRILSTTGETLEVREYERLSPLVPTRNSLCEQYMCCLSSALHAPYECLCGSGMRWWI